MSEAHANDNCRSSRFVAMYGLYLGRHWLEASTTFSADVRRRMSAPREPRGRALDGGIMSRSVAYALLCLLVVAVAHASSELNRVERDAKSGHAEWSYEDKTGPANWPKMFHKCGGEEQSPVNIIKNDLDPNPDLDAIDFENYDDDLDDAVMENNGHTVVVKPGDTDPTLTISDGGLDDTYKLIEIHFHWGMDSKRGSEHTIDGKQFPLEMHLVHMNAKYKTKEAALQKDDGLAVLGVLFKIDDEDNDELDPIVDQLEKVRTEDTKVDLENLKVDALLPDERMPYYRYKGSLTTPPCSEVVTWTIFENFVPISEKQMKLFRGLKEDPDENEPEEFLVDNFRPVQDLHTRVIEISVSGATTTPKSVATVLLFSTLAIIFTRV